MRNVPEEIYQFLVSRTHMTEVQLAALPDDECLVMIDKALNGIHEVGGDNKGQWVQDMQKTAGGIPGYSWCMYKNQTAVGCVERIKNCKFTLLVSGSCMDVLADAKAKGYWVPVGQERRSDLVIWQHGTSYEGHTGCLWSSIPGVVMTTNEGNSREGSGLDQSSLDAVNLELRPYGSIGDMHLMGFARLVRAA